MLGTLPMVFLGMVFYILGVVGTIFFDAPKMGFAPEISLLVVSLGIFFLSAFYFGRFGFILLLPAGFLLGNGFDEKTVFVFLTIMPLLFAVVGGSEMGHNAKLDLMGKKNFFDGKANYLAYAVLITIVSLAIGYFFG